MTSIQGVIKLFGDDQVSDVRFLPSGLGGVKIAHALFYSRHYYPRSDDDELRNAIAVKRGHETLYKYDIYLFADGGAEGFHCIVAVPFSALGREVFFTLHKASAGSRPLYRRIDLAGALDVLAKGATEQSRIAVRALEVPLGSEGNVDRLWLSGRDVVNSTAYRLLPKMLEVLPGEADNPRKCDPESCQFAYEGEAGTSFRLTADNQGNYSFHLRKDPGLLTYFARLLRFFYAHGITEDIHAWPWRGGSASALAEKES